MAELVYDADALPPGEPVFALHVGMDQHSRAILADLTMDLVAPVERSLLKPMIFTGFEHRASDVLPRAQQRAAEVGVKRILVIDPHGLLRMAGSARAGRR